MPRYSNKYKQLNRGVGKALHKYNMIADGDRIVIGVSGGKDSLTLMWTLKERLARIPIHYTLFTVYVDPGFENGFSADLQAFCDRQGFDLRVEFTDFGLQAHGPANRENPCFLCSRRRRQRLFEIADELDCTKLALGHHKDDIIETLFLNLCYAGEMSTMHPCQPFFNGRFTVIRPLAFVDENLIRKFAHERQFPTFTNPCPSSQTSKRQEIKTFLNQLYQGNRKVKGNIFRAMQNVNPSYLL